MSEYEIIIELMRDEIDAIQSYSEAIEQISDKSIIERLKEIRSDEEEHLKELKDLIK